MGISCEVACSAGILFYPMLWGSPNGLFRSACRQRGFDVHNPAGNPWRLVKLTRVALRFIDPESLPIPFQVVGFSVRWWVNLSEQKWVNSGERYRDRAADTRMKPILAPLGQAWGHSCGVQALKGRDRNHSKEQG